MQSFFYDTFGSLLEGDLSGACDYGYLVKQFDKQTGLYNYGYRDYTPKVAGFTTVDPIRDSENLVTYCRNDSVNHVDLWGLEAGDRIYNSNNLINQNDFDKIYGFTSEDGSN